ncbi:uncharacterized protein [Labrus bergylta]
MSDCIQESQKVLLVLSSEFVRSRWCLLEANMSLFRDCLERKPIVPVLLEPGVSIPLHLCHLTYLEADDPDFKNKLLKVLCTPNQQLRGSTVVPFQPPSIYNGKALQPLTAVNDEELYKWDCGRFSDMEVPDQLRLVIEDHNKYREAVRIINSVSENKADNNLLLNTSKTKEIIVDFRRERGSTHNPIHINGMAVERVSSFKFLGTHITEDLSWSTNTSSLVKKAHQRLFFLRTLKRHHLSSAVLMNFYRCVIESILTSSVSVWYGNCSVADRKALQWVVKTAQRITRCPLPAIEDVQRTRCLRRAHGILKDSSHPAHRLFTLLPSGRCFRSLRTRTSRLRNSFFPRAVSLLNSTPRTLNSVSLSLSLSLSAPC